MIEWQRGNTQLIYTVQGWMQKVFFFAATYVCIYVCRSTVHFEAFFFVLLPTKPPQKEKKKKKFGRGRVAKAYSS